MSIFFRQSLRLLALFVLLSGLPLSGLHAGLTSELVADAQTGKILYGSNINSLRHPASLTKIMTLYMVFLALEQGRVSLDDSIPVSRYASTRIPSKLGLEAGSRVNLRDAIMGVVTQSANDASVAIAEYLGGSEEGFATMMTERARALGMKRTVYRNASGLHDDEQVTTAFDQAILARAMLYHFPQQYSYFRLRSFTYDGVKHANHNRLMSRYSGMDGIKTGFIRQSGFNLVASAKRNGRRIIGVVFGGRTARSRDNRMAVLLDAGFERMYADSRNGGQYASVPVVSDNDDNTDVSSSAAFHIAQTEKVISQNNVAEGDEDTSQSPQAAMEPKNSSRIKSTRKTWAVQVGTYDSRKQSLSAIASAKKRAPSHLKAAKGDVISAKKGRKTIYRARLNGLSEKAARAACNSLSSAGHVCMTLPPKG